MKPYVRLEFLIDSYIKVPCKFCRNAHMAEFEICHTCKLSKNDRIERTQKFLNVKTINRAIRE
jgi:hypothetical protein